MADRRRVSFTSRDSPPSGSSRYTSDSGVGSLSDRATNASRAFPSPGSVNSQWNSLPDLQDAYRALYAEKDRYRAKARMLDEEATTARKNLKETEARYRGVIDRNEQLEEDKRQLFKERKALADQLNEKQDLVDQLRRTLEELELERSERKRSSRSPPTAGGNPDSSKPKRSPSKRESREVKDPKDEKRRLEKRFETKDGDNSESTSSSRATRASRRSSSYIEGWGPKSSAGPTSPRDGPPVQQYANYTQSPDYQPTFATMAQPAVSAVPRTIHPTVHVQTNATGYFEEDGEYHPYPLPREPRHNRSGR